MGHLSSSARDDVEPFLGEALSLRVAGRSDATTLASESTEFRYASSTVVYFFIRFGLKAGLLSLNHIMTTEINRLPTMAHLHRSTTFPYQAFCLPTPSPASKATQEYKKYS